MSVVALDVGSSSVRAAVFEEAGVALPGTSARREHRQQEGGVLDGDEVVAAAREVVAEAAGHASADAPIGVSCFWHSLVAVDRAGQPLTPLFTWRDVRAQPQAERLARALGADAVHARTGCPLHASFWPAKLAWLAETDPESFRRAHRFVGAGDLLLLREAGELRTSPSTASATGLHTDGGWDDELLAALGVDPERLPPVDDEPLGRWHPPLGDGACSNLGSGCTTPDRVALNVGTSAALRIVTTDAAPPPRGLFRYRLDAERAVVGGALSVGGNLRDWLDATLRLPESPGVAERPPAGHGLAFVPLLAGERSPGWDASRRGVVTGLRLETTPLDLAQAALEGLAFELRRVLELLPAAREVVAGGGALMGNPDWLQVVADVLGVPLAVSGEREASLRGAALDVLERLGAAPAVPGIEGRVEPRADRAAALADAYARHLRALEHDEPRGPV